MNRQSKTKVEWFDTREVSELKMLVEQAEVSRQLQSEYSEMWAFIEHLMLYVARVSNTPDQVAVYKHQFEREFLDAGVANIGANADLFDVLADIYVWWSQQKKQQSAGT